MQSTFSRRKFSQLALTVPLAASVRVASAQSDGPGFAGTLGKTRESFEADYGEGREEGWFTVYDFSDEGKASYWVAWDANGYAHRTATDFSALEGGGLPFSEDALGTSRFLPGDAFGDMYGQSSNIQIGEQVYFLEIYHSGEIANSTGRSGTVAVVDEWMSQGDGDYQGPAPISLSRATMEAYEVNPVIPDGRYPSSNASKDDMEAAFGPINTPSRGFDLIEPPVPGRWMFDGETIDVVFEEPVSAADGADWVSGFLEADLGEAHATFWMPAPGDTSGLRVHMWKRTMMSYKWSIQVVENSEETGTCSRFIIGSGGAVQH